MKTFGDSTGAIDLNELQTTVLILADHSEVFDATSEIRLRDRWPCALLALRRTAAPPATAAPVADAAMRARRGGGARADQAGRRRERARRATA